MLAINTHQIDALKQAETTIKTKTTGTTFAEFVRWQGEANAKQLKDDKRLKDFEVNFRKWQKIIDAQQPVKTFVAQQQVKQLVAGQRCEWCFREKGKTFTNHTEANCKNKVRAEKTKNNPAGCYNCGGTGHWAKDCPSKKGSTAQALSATTQTLADAVSEAAAAIRRELNLQGASANDVDNVSSVCNKVIDQYPVPPPSSPSSACTVPSSPSRLELQAALLSRVAQRMRRGTVSMIDTAATQTITPEASLVRDLQHSDKRIACANDSIMENNIQEGTLHATTDYGAVMPRLQTLTTPEAAATLISGPELVYKHHQDIVLSSEKGCFMQPANEHKCPVCNVDPNRINISGSSDGFTLNLHPQPERKLAYGLSDPPADLDSIKRELFPNGRTASSPATTPAMSGSEACPRTTSPSEATSTQSTTTEPPSSATATGKPHISEAGIQRFKLLHAALGGGITAHNVHHFMEMYPEYSDILGLPKALKDSRIRDLLHKCHGCDRAKFKKANAPPAVDKQVAPLEEVHLDIFTYPNAPRYDAFFIDRCTRACWHYSIDKKSDLPRTVQQFLVDVNTIADYAVGTICTTPHTLDAKEVNDFLSVRGCKQRVKVLFSDCAGETKFPEFEDFLADLFVKHRFSIPESQFQNALAEVNGGFHLVNMIRHDLDLSGLGPSFRKFCASLNAQRMNYIPRAALGHRTPASILYPDKKPPFKYFLPFGCQATVLRAHKDLRGNKLACRGRDGVYIGTAAPYHMTGFLVYLFPESNRGAGKVIVATHARFDRYYFPARKHDKRVTDFFATLPSSTSAALVKQDLTDNDASVVEIDLEEDFEDHCEDTSKAATDSLPGNGNQDAHTLATPGAHMPDPPIVFNQDAHTLATPGAHVSDPPIATPTSQPLPAIQSLPAISESDTSASIFPADSLEAKIYSRLQQYGSTLLTPGNHGHAQHHEDEYEVDNTIESINDITSDDIEPVDEVPLPEEHSGMRLRSGTVKPTYNYALIAARVIAKELSPLLARQSQSAQSLLRQSQSAAESAIPDGLQKARAFATRLAQQDLRNARAMSARTARTDIAPTIQHIDAAREHILQSEAMRKRTVTDIATGEVFDRVLEQYHFLGTEDLTPDGRITHAFVVRIMKKALKSEIRDKPQNTETLQKELKLLSTPKSAAEALQSPQWQEWLAAINKELKSLRDKEVYEVKPIPKNRKLIPTRLVLKIKLNSDGSIDKYKCRCVALGFLQRAGLDYDPDGLYSPMSDPSTTRSILAVSNALDLNIDHLDVRVAYLNGVLPENERFYCSPPAGFEEAPGYCWHILKGLYGSRQGGAVWAKTFREWMKTSQPQFKEAGNERCVYVFREQGDGTPTDLDNLRGIQLAPDERIIILVMNTDDMLIAYSENARSLVDDFELTLNKSYEATPRVPLEYYLGLHVQRDRKSRVLSLDARRHGYDFIRFMGLDPYTSAGVNTPLDPAITYSKADCPAQVDAELKTRILQAHGKLIHLAIWARPDLANAVSVLGRYIHNPSLKHWDAYIRIARYLVRTKDFRIVYGTHDDHRLALYGFTDSDWGADLDNRKSTGAYVFFLDGASCSWKVKLSATALLSTQEAEYVALSEATKEALNLRMLLLHLGFGDPLPTTIYCDNKGAITMARHPTNKASTRHVEMREHFARQHVELGNIETPFCESPDMNADSLSKATTARTHMRHTARQLGDQSLAPPLLPIQQLIAT